MILKLIRSKNIYLLLSTMVFSCPAFGEIEVALEPYLGYGYSGRRGGPSDSILNYEGFLAGARAVVVFDGQFFVGPDSSVFPLLDFQSSVTINSMKIQPKTQSKVTFGLITGIQLPPFFRIWMGYNFIDNISIFAIPRNYYLRGNAHGHSFKVGFGYSPAPLFSVNLEYLLTYYKNTEFRLSENVQNIPITSFSPTSEVGGIFLLSFSVPFYIPSSFKLFNFGSIRF